MKGFSIAVYRSGGGVWHDASVDCSLKLAALIGLSLLTLVLSLSPFPRWAAVSIGLSSPSAVDRPVLPILTSLHSLPFPQ